MCTLHNRGHIEVPPPIWRGRTSPLFFLVGYSYLYIGGCSYLWTSLCPSLLKDISFAISTCIYYYIYIIGRFPTLARAYIHSPIHVNTYYIGRSIPTYAHGWTPVFLLIIYTKYAYLLVIKRHSKISE